MRFPDRETVERLRSTYPAGCRIVLDEMDDPYTKIPTGAQATVTGVDDAGNVMCSWDMGSSLSIAYGADRCHKISTEAEAKITLDWYGKHQPEEDCRCPRCGDMMFGPKARHAISRWADITVCDQCGSIEALEKAGLTKTLPMMEWAAVKIPQIGGGRWRR
ncbi:MAG: DUF4314 domain-containing protein [Oribacterium sp.]|nr:DUF4314 domain-containing protein [Oribacterium sp.]